MGSSIKLDSNLTKESKKGEILKNSNKSQQIIVDIYATSMRLGINTLNRNQWSDKKGTVDGKKWHGHPLSTC